MSGWNYRVVKFVNTRSESYSVHEVHYDDLDKPAMYTVNPVGPYGESDSGDARGDFVFSFELWSKALTKPVLIVDAKTEKFTGQDEPPLFNATPTQTPPAPPPPPRCKCGREMVARVDWVCPKCKEEDWDD